jgi:hypothetical protein
VKSEAFEPLVAAITKIWDQTSEGDVTPEWFEKEVMPKFRAYMTWVNVYGSDDAVWVVHRYMQAVYADAPVNVTIRLLAEVVLSLRRELGNPETKVNALDIMGQRINDIYSEGVAVEWARLSEPELYKHEGWKPPWGKRFRYGVPLKP